MNILGLQRENNVWKFATYQPLGAFQDWAERYF